MCDNAREVVNINYSYIQNRQRLGLLSVYIWCPSSKKHKNCRSTVIIVNWGRCRGPNETKLTAVSSLFITLYLNKLAEYFTHPNGTSSV